MATTEDAARQFVEMARSKEDWGEENSLDPTHKECILNTLKMACFEEVADFTHHKIPVYNRDQDGSVIDVSHYSNAKFPFVALVGDDFGPYSSRATHWLGAAVALARRGEFDEAVKQVLREIGRSKPLEVIRITPDGDLLEENPPDYGLGMPEHTRDNTLISDLGGAVGIHAYCKSKIIRKGATPQKDALVCQGCHLRVLFHRSVTTYGQLRAELDPSTQRAHAS